MKQVYVAVVTFISNGIFFKLFLSSPVRNVPIALATFFHLSSLPSPVLPGLGRAAGVPGTSDRCAKPSNHPCLRSPGCHYLFHQVDQWPCLTLNLAQPPGPGGDVWPSAAGDWSRWSPRRPRHRHRNHVWKAGRVTIIDLVNIINFFTIINFVNIINILTILIKWWGELL